MIITNNFHDTEVLVDRSKPLNSNAIRRIKQALCGHADCTCSDALGGRGKQPTGYDDLLAHAEGIVGRFGTSWDTASGQGGRISWI